MKLMKKFKKRVIELGLKEALKFTFIKATVSWRRKAILNLESPEDRFTKIFTSNHWNNHESVSGEGSTFENTANIRTELPKIFDKYQLKSMLDAPCGDFNWMKLVIEHESITYIGGDIVQPLVEQNQEKYGDKKSSFIQLDLTTSSLPEVDLLFCRDCLFHLSYWDIAKVFENFLDSSIPYLMTTSSAAPLGPRINNSNIETGDMRLIDLFSKPFCLPQKDIMECVSDSMVSLKAERSMVLINRNAVKSMLRSLTLDIGSTI